MDEKKLFENFTETAGELVSREQVERLANRYYWAADYCNDKDVLELACGTGQGIGLLASHARRLVAGDIREEFVAKAAEQYAGRVDISVMDATDLKIASASLDVVVLFEALYFIKDQDQAVSEMRRLLRPGGVLLLTTPNPDAPDFHPFPYAHRYHGAADFKSYLEKFGFDVDVFGDVAISAVSWKQKVFRPLKMLAVKAGAVPTSKRLKRVMKRLLYGKLEKMPVEVNSRTATRSVPAKLSTSSPDRSYRVLYCSATLR